VNALNISFAPELPIWLILSIAALSGLFVFWGLFQQMRGAWFRAGAWLAITQALFNPSIVSQDREKLKSVVAVIVDNSTSQKLDGRAIQSEDIRASVVKRIKIDQ
jgi:hypothetical protein